MRHNAGRHTGHGGGRAKGRMRAYAQ